MAIAARPAGRAIVATLVATGAVLAAHAPAGADPPQSRIVAIYDADACAGAVCGSGDPRLEEGAAAGGPIQIHVRSQATFGLEWVRLQAHLEGTPAARWICLQQWRPPAGTFTFTGHFTWTTRTWPNPETPESDCEETALHYHGEIARNARYHIRVIARERPPERDIEPDSPRFTLRIANPPSAPTWADEPNVGGSARAPAVTLRWQANPEERTQPSSDVVEYHFVRVGPDGDQQEFAVGAGDPDRQGCQRIASIYQCVDRSFAAGAGGEYRYALLAYREGAGRGVGCATREGRCLESPVSEVRRVRVEVAAAAPAGAGPASPPGQDDASPSASPPSGEGGGETRSSMPAPVEVEPPRDRGEQLAAAAGGAGARAPALVPVAALLVLGTAALHLRRLLGSRR